MEDRRADGLSPYAAGFLKVWKGPPGRQTFSRDRANRSPPPPCCDFWSPFSTSEATLSSDTRHFLARPAWFYELSSCVPQSRTAFTLPRRVRAGSGLGGLYRSPGNAGRKRDMPAPASRSRRRTQPGWES